MKVTVSKILKTVGESLDFEVEGNLSLSDIYPDVREFLSPVKVKGTVTSQKDGFLVKGAGSVSVTMLCCRCLKPVPTEVHFELEELFALTGKEQEKETETFSGDTICLDQVVERSILTALPMKVLCEDNCKGLCPQCGKDLNEGPCGCTVSNIDPRFEGLRALFQLDKEV